MRSTRGRSCGRRPERTPWSRSSSAGWSRWCSSCSRSACSPTRSSSRRPASTRRRASRDATPTPATLAAVNHDFGLDRPFPIQYGLMMKKLFISRNLTSFVNRGQRRAAADRGGDAGDALARDRRGHHLGRPRDRDGARGCRLPRDVPRSVADGHRADRHLDAGLLARRGRQPDHAGPAALLGLLVGAAARLHADHVRTRSCGSSSCSSPGSRSRSCTSASTGACCARA